MTSSAAVLPKHSSDGGVRPVVVARNHEVLFGKVSVAESFDETVSGLLQNRPLRLPTKVSSLGFHATLINVTSIASNLRVLIPGTLTLGVCSLCFDRSLVIGLDASTFGF